MKFPTSSQAKSSKSSIDLSAFSVAMVRFKLEILENPQFCGFFVFVDLPYLIISKILQTIRL